MGVYAPLAAAAAGSVIAPHVTTGRHVTAAPHVSHGWNAIFTGRITARRRNGQQPVSRVFQVGAHGRRGGGGIVVLFAVGAVLLGLTRSLIRD